MDPIDYAIVVAHPDDEIIFASSIIKKAKKIIICFSEIYGYKSISKGREMLQKFYPYENTKFLNIPQSRLSKEKNISYGSDEDEDKIQEYTNIGDYKKNSKQLIHLLERELQGYNCIYTHNNIGEYGNAEHIQIHKIIMLLRNKFDYEVRVFGYYSSRNNRMLKSSLRLFKQNPQTKRTNIEIYTNLRDLYMKHNCWTWYISYKLPKFEFFYILDKNIESKTQKSNIIFNYIYISPISLRSRCLALHPLKISSSFIVFINKFGLNIRSILSKIYRIIT